jgi:shikimate dehydrogenase
MFNLDSRTFGVIGHPIGHTLSPVIHQTVFKRLGIAYNYEAFHVLPEQLSEYVNTARITGCPGFNVTIPHKETVIPMIDGTVPAVQLIGAVNTVKHQNGRLTGFNTDVIGLQHTLMKGGWSHRGKVIILGAGGAARAAVTAMGNMGVQSLILYDIVTPRAEKLANDFHGKSTLQIVIDKAEKHVPEVDLLINATPVGMWPRSDESPLEQPEQLPASATVFDMVYKPLKTRLIKQAESRGARTISGLDMLIAQALAADEIWLDKKLPEELFQEVRKTVLLSLES